MNDVAQTLSILDTSGLSTRATLALAYGPIALAIVSRTMNGSLIRKAHASDEGRDIEFAKVGYGCDCGRDRGLTEGLIDVESEDGMIGWYHQEKSRNSSNAKFEVDNMVQGDKQLPNGYVVSDGKHLPFGKSVVGNVSQEGRKQEHVTREIRSSRATVYRSLLRLTQNWDPLQYNCQ